MANLRVVYYNVANTSSGLVATTTAGSLAVSNLLTDRKSEVWRSTATSAELTVTWASAVEISMVALAFSNLSPTATVNVAFYTLYTDSAPAWTSPTVLCSPVSVDPTGPVGFGGGVYAATWFAAHTAQKIVITVADSSNPQGYIQASRLIAGTYWSPDRNVESDSVKIGMQEDTKHFRSESGSLWTDRGPMYKKLSFDLSYMTASDRNTIWRIIAGNGMSNAVYVSLMPESTDAWEEQIHSIYGRLSSSSALTYKYSHLHATQLQLEEV
jgi:hypothetical protein